MSKATQSLLMVVTCALATFIGIDALIGRIVPPIPHEYETVDAIRDYRNGDPQVLIIGSSYSRSFLPLAKWYRSQNPATDIAVVPIEGGKLYALDWLLQHRLGPLIDQTDGAGKRVRPRLEHLILQTNYFDMCLSGDEYGNLPARAWALPDYLKNFATHGATAFNSNYIDQRWTQASRWSSLISDRGFFHIIPTLRQKIGKGADEVMERRLQSHLDDWIKMIEANDMASPGCDTSAQSEAMDRILQFAEARKLDMSIVIWPVIPKALTPATLGVTEHFKAFVVDKVGSRPIPVIDMQAEKIVVDEDFRLDLDHLLPSGDAKVTAWARSGPFRSLPGPLVTSPPPASTDARRDPT